MNGHELAYLMAARERISRVYNDTRFPPPHPMGGDLRMFVITSLWVIGVERAPHGTRIQRVCDIMHLNNLRFWELIRSDLPRYEPASIHRRNGCAAWLPKARRTCGRGTRTGFRVTNPVDGTWEPVGYCSRHHEQSDAAWLAEQCRQQAGLPEPLPNRGGLLPCYLPWDWMKNYRKASGNWTPPAVGIRADDWPVLAKVEAADPNPPRLSVLTGDERTLPKATEADAGPPQLRLISKTATYDLIDDGDTIV